MITSKDRCTHQQEGDRNSVIYYTVTGFQKDTKFWWVTTQCEVVVGEMAYYLAKKGTKIHQTSTCKVSLFSAKLRKKIKIQADLSRYYITKDQHTLWNKVVKNRNIIPDFPREDVAAIF